MTRTTRRLLLVFSLLGLAASTTSSVVHYRLLTQPGYASFCDVNGTVSCTEAYLSRFGSLWGVPVALGGMLFFGLVLALVSVVFGLFWVETANMDAKSVAGQLTESGIQIPGFRRDPRMLETILNKHIFPLTVMGSICVGLLAGIADLTGALGTGTGILLTVGILHKMYEQLEQLKSFELFPSLSLLLAGE